MFLIEFPHRHRSARLVGQHCARWARYGSDKCINLPPIRVLLHATGYTKGGQDKWGIVFLWGEMVCQCGRRRC